MPGYELFEFTYSWGTGNWNVYNCSWEGSKEECLTMNSMNSHFVGTGNWNVYNCSWEGSKEKCLNMNSMNSHIRGEQ